MEGTIRLLFRDAGDGIGANALALPAGTIVFPDQFVHSECRAVKLMANPGKASAVVVLLTCLAMAALPVDSLLTSVASQTKL
jgi:hypothetical protein